MDENQHVGYRVERIIAEFRQRGVVRSIAEFARFIDYGAEQTIRDIIKQRVRSIPGEFAYRLYRAGVNLEYLFEGRLPILYSEFKSEEHQCVRTRGLMLLFQNYPEIKEAMQIFLHMDAQQQKHWIEIMRKF
ncbi:MAG: hypothetical protein KDK30_12310 [Leptospiraceae bacterium]|nr:hypothetical protein [Leptospiraceae bacterium]MCB1315003.1 hypothetical protein [Leptospiraceae bacterium]